MSIADGMYFSVGDCLRQVYENEKKQEIAGWFCETLLQEARRLNALYLVAKYQACYVEHLKNIDELPEASEEAQLLLVFLEDEFGEDYLEWLEGAPNAGKLCEELETQMSKG